MNKIEYTKMFELEDSHFWFVAKRNFVESLLNPYKHKINKILDLGSGTGGMTKFLEKYGEVTGIENNPYAIKLAGKRGLKIKTGDINNFKVKNNAYDLITIFDVLYHQNIKDESIILKSAYNSLKKGGLLLITDSALEILTGPHDTATRGKRRYSINKIKLIVKNQNFKILKASYIYMFIFPFIFINRFIIGRLFKSKGSDVNEVPKIINTLLLHLLTAEAFLLKSISFPIGSSIILLAVKK